MTDRWVSGVFEREPDARQYLEEIPEAERAEHKLEELDGVQYPVYLIEDSNGFRFMTAEAALADIKAHAPTVVEEHCCATLYRFDRDYRPRIAGEDQMGRIRHEHVDNEVLSRVQREGRTALWIMR